MESIYSRQLLETCLRNEPWSSALLDRAIAEQQGRALLAIVVERLGDLFEPSLCRTYDRLFTQVIERVCPELIPRLRSEHRSPIAPAQARKVYVLSRITLGADVAVTSVLLDAAKRRYPEAQIVFVGPRKSYEMFEADPRISFLPAPYARSGSLMDRLQASASLHFDDGIVIDPDSRLTQLGLISVCALKDYFFFESRSYGGSGTQSLSALTSSWAEETFGITAARPYISPQPSSQPPPDITVNLGVGENFAKRIAGNFESELVRALAETGASILIDKGLGADERERVERAMLPGLRAHDGPFAPFAAQIARSKMYVGYDSAGQHVASACGIPLISIFKGFVSERMLARWRPAGTVLRGDSPDILNQVRAAITCTFHR